MAPLETIIGPYTRRADRLPPNQTETRGWPPMQWGDVPPFEARTWDFSLFPRPFVDAVKRFSWPEFQSLPRVQVFADLHCSTGESKLDNLWEGVRTAELRKHVNLAPAARFVMVHCEYGYTANLPIDDFFGEDCLFALRHNGADLAPEHGYPVRLVIPKLYACKSAKWVRGIEFLSDDRPGFRDQPRRGDPWREERQRSESPA